jgi:hypothetical protein
VEDKDIFGSKQVGLGKIPLAHVPTTRFDGAFTVFDTRGRQTGIVDLGLCLERFSTNTQPPFAGMPLPPAPVPMQVPMEQREVLAPVPAVAVSLASSAVYMPQSPFFQVPHWVSTGCRRSP